MAPVGAMENLAASPLRRRLQLLVGLVALLTIPACAPSPDPLPPGPPASSEWHQHAYDAQHSGFAPQSVPYPWRLRWIWNGVAADGSVSKVTTDGSLPRNVQPVTGGGRVYIAAGVDGVFALDEVSGAQLWQARIGDVRSTVAYDPATQAVFAVSAGGVLHKLRADTGAEVGSVASGQASDLPLPPAVADGRVFFAMGQAVHAVEAATMRELWTYWVDPDLIVAVPPAYSPSHQLVVVATEPDLYVHAIDSRDGMLHWRVRPVHESRRFEDPTEYRYGWPVIAEGAGLVLIKVRLDWQALWREWPQDNAAIRAFLQENPDQQALFALRLQDGSIPFIANVGHGGYGDSDYLPMGPQPVVRRLADGSEVVYIVVRARGGYDSRWDSHFGEMVLDSQTIEGLQGGDVRLIAFDHPPGSDEPFLLTDEQPNVTVAGDYLFGAHWEAGFAMRLLDRSPAYGSFAAKIPTQRLATVVTSQDDTAGCAFSPSHYCPANLANTRPYDYGFYIYYDEGPVYDRYWSEYASFVVSNGTIYFRSVDGAVLALASGTPEAGQAVAVLPFPEPVVPVSRAAEVGLPVTIPFDEARRVAGEVVTVTGTLRYTVNNGKHLLLAFAEPHRGAFKVIIPQPHWDAFGGELARYRPGAELAVTGLIAWYQGDPAMVVSTPEAIWVVEDAP